MWCLHVLPCLRGFTPGVTVSYQSPKTSTRLIREINCSLEHCGLKKDLQFILGRSVAFHRSPKGRIQLEMGNKWTNFGHLWSTFESSKNVAMFRDGLDMVAQWVAMLHHSKKDLGSNLYVGHDSLGFLQHSRSSKTLNCPIGKKGFV